MEGKLPDLDISESHGMNKNGKAQSRKREQHTQHREVWNGTSAIKRMTADKELGRREGSISSSAPRINLPVVPTHPGPLRTHVLRWTVPSPSPACTGVTGTPDLILHGTRRRGKDFVTFECLIFYHAKQKSVSHSHGHRGGPSGPSGRLDGLLHPDFWTSGCFHFLTLYSCMMFLSFA